MIASSYQSWCHIIGEEIVKSLSAEDKDTLRRLGDLFKNGKLKRKETQHTYEDDIIKYLRMTPKQRLKSKFLKDNTQRRLIIYFALYALHEAHLLLDAVEGLPVHGPYREIISIYARQANYLKVTRVKPLLLGDSFEGDPDAFSVS